MGIKCVLGLHKWDGCKCSSCGKVRGIEHDWSDNCEKCSRCGETREGSHAWNGCECSTCGMFRDIDHNWSQDCQKCSKCGKSREVGHDWSDNCEKCSSCEKTRIDEHDWDGCLCKKCKLIRNEGHEVSGEGDKCQKCGKEPYKIGQPGTDGGIVVYVDDSGYHGLEVKTADDGEADWPKSNIKASSHGNGWRLPTVQELQCLYANKDMVGGFKDGWYWSSSEFEQGRTWYAVVFSNGNVMPLRKHGDACYIRAVRVF